MKYYIVGKNSISGPTHDISGDLNSYYELGWEIMVTHYRIKKLFYEKIISTQDVIVTTNEERKFLYESIFENVITWEEFLKIDKGDTEVVDLVNQSTNDNFHNEYINYEPEINNQELKLSDSNDIVKQFIELSPQNNKSRKTSKKNDSSSVLKHIINDSMKGGNTVGDSVNVGANSNTINSNIRNKLLKNLESETESIAYKPNEKYQDIFSNSEIRKDTVKIEGNQDEKTKDKFFNNYLNI